eukprot:8150656-Pyramimonas_sp.AAC.1
MKVPQGVQSTASLLGPARLWRARPLGPACVLDGRARRRRESSRLGADRGAGGPRCQARIGKATRLI